MPTPRKTVAKRAPAATKRAPAKKTVGRPRRAPSTVKKAVEQIIEQSTAQSAPEPSVSSWEWDPKPITSSAGVDYNAVVGATIQQVRESVLQEGQRIIHGSRRVDYGPAEESFQTIWTGWEPILRSNISGPAKVALCMDWLKTCRYLNSRDRDSLVDKAGYVGLTAQVDGIDQ